MEINKAKGLRFTMTLYDEEINIEENAGLVGKVKNKFAKLNILKKDKEVLFNKTYKLSEIKNAVYSNPTQDTSVLKLEFLDNSFREFEMTPTDIKNSNALKTQVKQIADYINSKK